MRNNNVGDDLRAMAQDVADLGAGYMRMGRRWLEMQRQQVTGEAEAEDSPDVPPDQRGDRGRRAGRGHGGTRFDSRGGRGRAGAGMDSYLDEEATPGYVSPGSTQSPFGGSSVGADSDYLPPGNRTSGRASYRGVGPKNYTRSDQRITEDLCEGLTRDDHVDPSDISVNVSGGVVTLGGTVRDRWMKHRIEDIAAACDGVRSVENNIRLPAPAPSAGSTTATGPDSPDAPVI